MKKKFTTLIGTLGVFLLIQPVHTQTWNATKRLTYNSGYSQAPVININSNNHIHVVWTDDTPGNGEVYHKRSTNGGTTWTTKRLTYNSGYTHTADIALDSSNHLHVVWDDDSSGNWEIYYKKSTNGGTTWTTKRLTYNSGISNYPTIAIDSSNHIHVVWDDRTPGNREIYHKRSTDEGATWTTKRLTHNSGDSNSPDIAIDSSNHIHVVWYDWTPGINEIYYKKSTNGGAIWTTKRMTYNPGNSAHPEIAIDSSDHIHVVWYDYSPGNWEIFHKKSIDGGKSWSKKRLTYNSGWSTFPDIATDSDDHIHVVWKNGTALDGEIYYKRSTNGGSNWTTKRLTFNSGNSTIPTITVGSNGHIHVVWRDYTPGNQEIFYKKGIQ
jgi:hypothetical protein